MVHENSDLNTSDNHDNNKTLYEPGRILENRYSGLNVAIHDINPSRKDFSWQI